MSCAITMILSADDLNYMRSDDLIQDKVKAGDLIQDKVKAVDLIQDQIQKKKTKKSTKKTKTWRLRQKVKIEGWPKLHPMSAYQSLNGMRCEC